jgi:hypothetical protein
MTEEKSSMELEQQTVDQETKAESLAENAEAVTESKSEDVPVEAAQEGQANNTFKVNIPEEKEARPARASATKKEPLKKKSPAVSKKQLKSEKKAKNTVIILSCLMALITVVTALLGATTDIFKDNDVKAVAVLILPQEDKEALERHLSKIRSLAETGFDTEKMSGEELFSYIKPWAKDGLYASFGYTTEKVSDIPDPADRFHNENGEYAYYKIPSAEIDSILSHFDVETNHALNSGTAYYFDGFYYFDYEKAETQAVQGDISVIDSKRIQDGRYYATCKFGEKEVYVIASMISTDEGNLWKIHSMSLTPVFDALGIMIKSEDDNAGKYEMRQLIIEGKTKDDIVFKKYVLKYPYFFGDSQGEIQANNFYSSLITFYRQQSEQVQSDYKKFTKKGGKSQDLPLELHYTASVSFFDETSLCLINEITESVPAYESDENEVKLGVKTVECNTFDVQTGLYMAKDALVGKDYITLSEILYRIYSGYGYESLVDETVPSEDVPEDIRDIGDKIYDSAVTKCKDGYVFCYVNEEGIREDVVVPFETVEKLNQE